PPRPTPSTLSLHDALPICVPVHEAGRDNPALGVDDLARRLPDAADGSDPAGDHADVAPIPGQPGSIHHPAILDHEVIGHRLLLSALEGATNRVTTWYSSSSSPTREYCGS